MRKTTLYILGAIIALAVLYALVVGIKYACFGSSDEGHIIPPGDFDVTVE